jgi:hypothetical protein
MQYLRVRNWDRWQSYRKDRGQPPWIKLWRSLLRNVDWLTLTDEQRGQLVGIWMLAADRDGTIPADPAAVKLLCSMQNLPDFMLFRDKGFLEFDARVASSWRQGDATLASGWRQRDASESESESEAEKIPAPEPKPKTARQAPLAASVTAVQIVTLVNERFGTNRSASPTLIRAVEILLRAGHAADDIMLVVRHRLTNEEWFTPAKFGAESLIRRDKFPSMLQVAKDSQPRPITSASVDEGGWEY